MVTDPLAESLGQGGAIALIGEGRTWTVEELGRVVDARCAELEAEGIGSGTVVPLKSGADPAGWVEILALWRLGAVPAPLHPGLSHLEYDWAAATLDATDAPAGCQVILWTSGTSGQPRGVALSWANLMANVTGTWERLALTEDDVWLASLSPAHVGGLALMVRSTLIGGALVCVGPYQAERVSGLIDTLDEFDLGDRALTHLSLVPTQLHQIMEHRGDAPPPKTLRCALIGGAFAPESLVTRALGSGWPLSLTYGATEMASQIATAPPALTRMKPGTVGPPMPGVEIRVLDDGEIEVRGPTRALDYVPEQPTPLADPAGWYRTGDMGYVDDDEHLWITGRRIDRIVSGGLTIDALEVEEALRSHPSVLDACVVGLIDDVWGERVAAWVDPVVGEFDIEEVDEHLRDLLSSGKLPTVWHVEGGLPRNPNGKIDRSEVRAVFERLN
jgi:O-succinylbenzoic acid--CoA ligase